MGREPPVIDHHFDAGPVLGQLDGDPGQSEPLPQGGATPGAGDPAHGTAAAHDRNAVARHHPVLHDESHQLLFGAPLAGHRQAAPSDEIVLVEPDHPLGAGLQGIGRRVGILTDDEVSLFQAQYPLGFQAKGGNAEFLARLHQGGPHVFTVFRREVDLPAGLSHEAYAKEQAGDAGYFSPEGAHVPERLGRQVDAGDFREGFPGPGTGDVYRRRSRGHIGYVGAPSQTGLPPVEPLLHNVRVTGGGRDEIGVLAGAGDGPVVHYRPVIGTHQAVAYPSYRQVGEPVGVEAVQQSPGV